MPAPVSSSTSSNNIPSRLLDGVAVARSCAIRYFTRRAPPAGNATLFGPASAALARLLPEIAELLPSSTPQPPIAPEQDQRQLTLALARCFTRLGAHPDDAGQSARLLIIEDLHWSDEASLEVLLALARHVPAQPMEDLIAEGDKVAARMIFRGTHTGGEFMGIPPSGRPFAFSATAIFRIVGGKIVEHWGDEDALGWLQQLGAMPAPG